MSLPFIFDAHLDLAMNAIEWNRDLTRPLQEIREREKQLRDKPDRGNGTVCLPEMRRGRIGICVNTQIARVEHAAYSPVAGWRSAPQAWGMTQAQLAWYEAMEEAGEMKIILDLAALEAHFKLWTEADDATAEKLPIGYIMSLEGADSLITIAHLERAYESGLRAIGLAHYGPGRYAQGTSTEGPFPARGLELLKEASRLGFILDLTHLSDECFWQALDLYDGPIWASHHNARTLVPHQRQLSDEMFKAIVERGGVVGLAFDGWMIAPNWVRGTTTPQSADLNLEKFVRHMDHFCQLAGNAKHIGIGSDLDGAFGIEQTPKEITSIAELQRLNEVLAARGFSRGDIDGILHGNFLHFLRKRWK